MSSSIWKRLASSKAYREAFVGSQAKRTIPFQVRALRQQRGWSQAELAERAAVTQGVISRVEDPDYGNLTLNTIVRVAAGFDCAFVGRFIPFSELVHWYDTLSEGSIRVPSFADDRQPVGSRPLYALDTSTVVSIIASTRWQRPLRAFAVEKTRASFVSSGATYRSYAANDNGDTSEAPRLAYS